MFLQLQTKPSSLAFFISLMLILSSCATLEALMASPKKVALYIDASPYPYQAKNTCLGGLRGIVTIMSDNSKLDSGRTDGLVVYSEHPYPIQTKAEIEAFCYDANDEVVGSIHIQGKLFGVATSGSYQKVTVLPSALSDQDSDCFSSEHPSVLESQGDYPCIQTTSLLTE